MRPKLGQPRRSNWLDRPVGADDHFLGLADAPITLVDYGSYGCPTSRGATERFAEIRDQYGDRMRYVFRHRPFPDSPLARRAAELVERAATEEQFWTAHVTLMTRSPTLTEDDLRAVAEELGLGAASADDAKESATRAKARVDADERSALASGVLITPTLFINGRRYDGPWDPSSFADAVAGRLGHRVKSAALDFAGWGPSAGVLLLVATLLAVALTNSAWGSGFDAFWERSFGFTLNASRFDMSLRHWVNDGLLTIFFLVVGLEIKREFTVGHLAGRRSAALPIAAAIGGMVVPAGLYMLVLPEGPWSHGWGVPMATDTAFAVALIVMMGSRVPLALRIFLTAAAIVDDIGAIGVVAVFYSSNLDFGYIAAAGAVIGVLVLFNRISVYRVKFYLAVGVVLWACVYASGLHPTLAGVLLALFIPTRPPPNLEGLIHQATTILAAEARRGDEVLRLGPSAPALRALDAIHDRLESPADRLLRHAGARSSYIVLPLFALANAGVDLSAGLQAGHEMLALAIVAGLVVGKPLGLLAASVLAVRLGLAEKPGDYSWRQLAGASALAGIGFTMSLFIAGQAFPAEADFAAAKIAVFAASVLSALIGVGLLWRASRSAKKTDDGQGARRARVQEPPQSHREEPLASRL